jgi:hypothetical protein
LSDAEVDAAVAAAMASTGAAGAAGIGKVMAVLKGQLAGRVDMSAVSAKVKAALAAWARWPALEGHETAAGIPNAKGCRMVRAAPDSTVARLPKTVFPNRPRRL